MLKNLWREFKAWHMKNLKSVHHAIPKPQCTLCIVQWRPTPQTTTLYSGFMIAFWLIALLLLQRCFRFAQIPTCLLRRYVGVKPTNILLHVGALLDTCDERVLESAASWTASSATSAKNCSSSSMVIRSDLPGGPVLESIGVPSALPGIEAPVNAHPSQTPFPIQAKHPFPSLRMHEFVQHILYHKLSQSL